MKYEFGWWGVKLEALQPPSIPRDKEKGEEKDG